MGAMADGLEEYPVMVLLVDDQPMMGEAIRRMVAGQPMIDFHYCSSAHDALAIAREIKPTVILQDLAMPGVSGLDLVQQYRADPSTSQIPVIVLSATESPEIKREAFQAGASDYLVKIPDEIELIARLRHHSRAYLNQLQRDEAYRALRESQQQLMEANLALQRLTNVDALTGLSNRRYFDQQIEAEWVRALQRKSRLALLMVDVDRFKELNDARGHRAGDDVLKTVAAAIETIFPASSCVARYGGDEFAILVDGATVEDMRGWAELLCTTVAGSSSAITVSVGGITRLPDETQTYEGLIDAADVALYAAKRWGRNRSVLREE